MGYANATPIEIPRPEVDTDSITDKIDNMDFATEAINWVWEQTIGNGKDLFETLLEPITGDFNRIKANGKAWESTGDSLVRLGTNVEANARKLKGHWAGEASEQFYNGILMQWLPATLAAEQVCKLMGKGFEKLGDACIAAGMKIVEVLLPKILRLIGQIARRATPVVGWLGAIWDGITKGKLPIVSEIEMIKDTVEQVLALHEKIRAVVQVAKDYVDGARAIIDLITTIPKLDGNSSVYTAREMGKQFDKGVKAYETYAGQVKKDEDGNVIEDDHGRVVREKSRHSEAVDGLEGELEKMDESTADLKSRRRK